VSPDTLVRVAGDFSPRYERHTDDLVSIDVSGLQRLLKTEAGLPGADDWRGAPPRRRVARDARTRGGRRDAHGGGDPRAGHARITIVAPATRRERWRRFLSAFSKKFTT
jgi:hypothetical protein